MACNLNIKASNNKNSVLFRSLATATNSLETAVDQYYYIKSDKFKNEFGDWEVPGAVDKKLLDENGEPLYSELGRQEINLDLDYAEIELDQRADAYKEIIEAIPKIRSKVESQIARLEAAPEPPKALGQLKELLDKLNKGTIDDSLPMFLNMSNRHVNGMLNRAMAEADKSNTSVATLSSIYKASQSYQIIADIQNSLLTSESASIIIGENTSADQTVAKMNKIETIYLRESKKFLIEELYKYNPTWDKVSIKKWLNDSPGDLKYTEKMLEYMADSKDKLLANIANIVMSSEHENRYAAIEFNNKLEEALKDVEKKYKSGNAEEIFSKIITNKEDGLHILNLYADPTIQKKEFNKVESLRVNEPELYKFLVFFTEIYSDLQAALPNGSRLGTRLPSVLKATRERAQGATMKEKYKNLSDDAKKSFQASNMDMEKGTMVDSTGKTINYIPIFYTKKYDSVDFNKAFDSKYKELTATGMSETEAKIDATEYATKEAVNINKKLVSKDLAYSLQAFHAMATNYTNKNQIATIIESAQAVVGSSARSYVKTDSAGKAVMKRITGDMSVETIGGQDSDAKKALDAFLSAHFYGQKEKDLGTRSLFGIEVDVNKSLRNLNKYTSWVQMSLNTFAGLANLGTGEIQSFIESMGGEYYGAKNMRKTTSIYAKNFGGILEDVGNRTPKKLVGLLDQHYNILMDFQPKHTIKGTENTSAKRLLKTDLAFFMQNSGEHFMQTRAGMAVMDNFTAYNKEGKESGTILDAHTVKDGKLIIADVYIKDKSGKLVKYNKAQQKRIANKMTAVLRKQFGNYSALTMNNFKQHALGALVMKYRDWAYEGVVKRFGKSQHYENLEQDVEGFYITGAKVMKQTIMDLKRLEFSVAKENWSKLSSHEKANIRRLASETAIITALAVAGALLGKAGKMVEDEYGDDTPMDRAILGSFNMLVYQTNRLFTEIAVFVDPREMIRMAQTPAASTNLIKATWQLLAQVTDDTARVISGQGVDRYERGWRKGETKVGARLEKLVPMYKNIKTLNPEGIKDKGVFYNID